jgi:hypothetical protein
VPGTSSQLSGAQVRNGLIWLAFALALVLATKPVWGFWVFGFNPSFEDLLRIRCF